RSVAAQRTTTALGLEYSIDTALFQENAIPAGQEALREWAAFSSFTGRVRFAAGRGRLDILTRRAGPLVVVDSFAVSAPLGGPGDYYLFDRRGFVLVHPSSKTYSTFSISGDSFGFPGTREGWPRAFQFVAPRLDTAGKRGYGEPKSHDPIHVFWHSDD